MPTISLTLPSSGTIIAAGLHSTNYSALQALLNGGLDASNWASGKILAPSKLTQEGAATGQALVWNGTSWVPTSISADGYSTALPSSPTDGQTHVLVDSITLPTYQWRFRYNSGSSNTDKWEFTGGAPALTEVATPETTASASYAALATAGPSFTVPRAGVYDIEIGAQLGAAAAAVYKMSYDIGGTGAVDADALERTQGVGAGDNAPGARTRRKSGLAASTALVAKYKTSASTLTAADRWMRVTPVRVS